MTDALNYINLVHGIDNTRVYRLDAKATQDSSHNEFFCYTATRSEITPFYTVTAKKMAEHLIKVVENEPCQVELMFGYKRGSLSKNAMGNPNRLFH